MTFGHEVRREERADCREPQRRLVGEVELVDGAQERERGSANWHVGGEASATTVSDSSAKSVVSSASWVQSSSRLGALMDLARRVVR